MEIKIPKRLIYIPNIIVSFGILYLLYSFRGFISDVTDQRYTLVHNATLLSLYFISLYFLFRVKKNFDVFSFSLVFLFIGYNCLTIYWSGNVTETMKSCIGILGVSVFAIVCQSIFGQRFAPKCSKLIGYYCIFFLPFYIVGFEFVTFGGAIDEIVMGSHITTSISFSALTGHKNLMGNMAGLAAAITYCLYRENRQKSHLFQFFCLVFALMLAQASTSLLGLLASVCALELSLFGRKKPISTGKFIFFSSTIFSVFLFFISSYWSSFLLLLGEDATLSSRTIIWEMVLAIANDNFWFGEGFGSFWADGSIAQHQSERLFYGTSFKQSHNGYIDLFAQSGFLGLLLGVTLCIVGFLKSYSNGLRKGGTLTLWAGLVFLLVNNLGEANLFIPNYFSFAYLTVCVMLKNENWGADNKRRLIKTN